MQVFFYGEGKPRLDLEYPVYGAHELADEGAFTSVVGWGDKARFHSVCALGLFLKISTSLVLYTFDSHVLHMNSSHVLNHQTRAIALTSTERKVPYLMAETVLLTEKLSGLTAYSW